MQRKIGEVEEIRRVWVRKRKGGWLVGVEFNAPLDTIYM